MGNQFVGKDGQDHARPRIMTMNLSYGWCLEVPIDQMQRM